MQRNPTAAMPAVPLITPTALNEDVMTQMAAMRIIRRQRLQDLERLNSVVMRFMEQGVSIKTFSDKQIAVAQHVLTTNPMQYELVRVCKLVCAQKLVNTIMDAVDTVSNKQNASFSTILNDTGDDFDIEVASVASSDDGDDGETTSDPAGSASAGISVDRADFMIEKLSQLEAELERLKQENERLAESTAAAGAAAPAPTAAAPAQPLTPTQAASAPTHSSPGTAAAVQQHRSALSAVLSGLGGAKATLRPAGDGSANGTPRAPASPIGMEGMLKASMAQRRMRLQEGADDISIASDSSFESPGSVVAPPAAARCHRRTSTAPTLSSPLVAGLSPIGPPSAGSVASEGSGASAARRRSSVSGRAKRRLATCAIDADVPTHPASPLSQGRRSTGGSGGNGAVPLPRAMAMPASPRLPAPPAAASAAAAMPPTRPAGMGALLGAIKSKGGVKGLKKAPKPAPAAERKAPPAGGLLGAIASFDKSKGLRKAKAKKATTEAVAPAAASGGRGGLNPAALMSAAARLNKTPKGGKGGAARAVAGAAAAPSGMRSPFGDMGAIKLRSTGRRSALK